MLSVYGLGVGPVFPLLVGALAQSVGIARSYWFCAAAVAGLLAGVMVMRAARKGQKQASVTPLSGDS